MNGQLHTDNSPMLDAAAVDQIVANVLKQLSSGGGGSSGSGNLATAVAPAPAAVPVKTDSSQSAAGARLSTVTLTERIITGDLLTEKASGASQIIIPVKAILTPTAHDFLKAYRTQVVRGSGAPASKSGEAITSTWKWITVTSTASVSRLSDELGAGWSREVLGCPDDAAALAISAICRGEASGVAIISQQHFRAACRANRNDKVRAVPISSPAEVKAAREQLRLNVIAIDPTSRSYFELKNILGAFTAPAK
jgi:hypothetical protein